MKIKEVSGILRADGLTFGVVVSRFNDMFSRQLLRGALDCLERHGAGDDSVEVVWVPGSFEAPAAVQKLARAGRFDALMALGVVIQGDTPHAGLVSTQAARALSQISLQENVPVIDGIVSAENLDQAIDRSGAKAGNRGWAAALSAIEMAMLFKALDAK